MSVFEWNKIIGAVLVPVLVVKVISITANELTRAPALEKNVYVVPGVQQAAPTEPEKPAAKPAAKEGAAMIGPLLAAASAEAGKKTAKKCTLCHSFKKGGKTKIGPNLWDIVNAKPARSARFSYSSGMAKMGGKWGYEELNAFLANPKRSVPGTKMVFAGIKKASDRANLIAYLRSLSDKPAPLP